MSQEAKHALTVVGSHADHAILGQCSAVISRLTATASHESTAIGEAHEAVALHKS